VFSADWTSSRSNWFDCVSIEAMTGTSLSGASVDGGEMLAAAAGDFTGYCLRPDKTDALPGEVAASGLWCTQARPVGFAV
jgi:hypothetical protein